MSSVYHRRRELSRFLRRVLPTDFVVVANPDHPLLLRSADVLVGGRRTLTAIFTPTSAERRNHGELKSRFVLSRLALPPHARCVLVAEPKDYSVADEFSRHFATTVEWRKRHDLAKIAEAPAFAGRHRDLPPDTIAKAQHSFATAMDVVRLVARLSGRPFSGTLDGKSSGVDAIRSREVRILRDERRFDNVTLAEFSDGTPDARIALQLVQRQSNELYSLDDGMPYGPNRPPGMIVVSDWPLSTKRPEKLIHAAAFAGWAFVLRDRHEDLPRLAARLSASRR